MSPERRTEPDGKLMSWLAYDLIFLRARDLTCMGAVMQVFYLRIDVVETHKL